ncbi:MAG: hypothetical protein ACRDDX_02870 [Cellulosilyticaceae bacterium]
MDIRWSYYLIVALYAVLITLKLLNKRQENQFAKDHEGVEVYKGSRKDFFTIVAFICSLITLIINGVALFAGKPLIWTSIFITVCIIGMALLTVKIQVLTTADKRLCVGGTFLEADQIKEVIIKEKKSKTYYEILFNTPIQGYEGVEFAVSGEQKESFTNYIKTI